MLTSTNTTDIQNDPHALSTLGLAGHYVSDAYLCLSGLHLFSPALISRISPPPIYIHSLLVFGDDEQNLKSNRSNMFILWMHNIGFVADTSSADVSKFSLADADMFFPFNCRELQLSPVVE